MIIKKIIDVPQNVRYISDWKEFKIPEGQLILDKQICGCGFTDFCLKNKSDNIILCSPRLSLIENKVCKNPQVFQVKNNELTGNQRRSLNLLDSDSYNRYLYKDLSDRIKFYLGNYIYTYPVKKFMVTYDSFPKLLEILSYNGEDISNYKIIIDEFQLIFTDSKFKADIEFNFVTYVRYCPNVVFLSATPMVDECLEELEEFNNLPFYCLNWGDRIIKTDINPIQTRFLEQTAIEIINLYRSGDGPKKIINGIEYQSREAVFYLNNISAITYIIKKAKLISSEVNIIIADTPKNRMKLRKCGKGFNIGIAPGNGDPHKMFTFCTSTAYCGMDFYSTSAKSYVFSDCNINSLSLDISIELPQIAGRQRRDDNVFKNDITLFYTTNVKDITKEDLENNIRYKIENTYKSINNFEILRNNGGDLDNQLRYIRTNVKYTLYDDDYTSIYNDPVTNIPYAVVNKLVISSERRAWFLQNEIYKNRLSVLNTLGSNFSIEEREKYHKLESALSISDFNDKIKALSLEISNDPDFIKILPKEYKEYFEKLGQNYLKNTSESNRCFKYLLKEKLDKIDGNSKLQEEFLKEQVYKIFKVGTIFSKREIKCLLQDIYDHFKIKLIAKSSNITDYFEVERKRLKNNKGSYDEGFLIVKKK